MLKLTMMIATFVATTCWINTSRADEKTESLVSVMIDCASDTGGYVECDAGALSPTSVRLVLETSRAGACVSGSTWGTVGRVIWVSHGCSGRFEVTADQGVAPAPPAVPPTAPSPPAVAPPPPPPPRAPVLDVDCRFNNTNWQPFYRCTNHWVGRPGFGFQDANTCVAAVQMSRSNVICNWSGRGFTPYDIESNREFVLTGYPSLQACYAAVP